MSGSFVYILGLNREVLWERKKIELHAKPRRMPIELKKSLLLPNETQQKPRFEKLKRSVVKTKPDPSALGAFLLVKLRFGSAIIYFVSI